MTSLATRYLGLELAQPIVPGASPLADDLDQVLLLEDAGASAIVMRSIFEEQITLEQMAAHRHLDVDLGAEAAGGLFLDTDVFALGLDSYLEQLRRIRQRTSLKVIGSLNGTTPGGWTEYARRIEEAGAHALELNLYSIPSDVRLSASDLEQRQLATVREVTHAVKLPVGVKLSPYYSSLPHFVQSLEDAGAKAAVLFNRFYQADIDAVLLEGARTLYLSTPDELLLRLRWLAIVSPQTRLELAASGGVHAALDVVKAIMAGAQVVQVVSTLLRHGPKQLRVLVDGLTEFLDQEEYTSLAAMRGNMSHARAPNPEAYERADYIHMLSSWHGRTQV
jgi:dihydroorotate dehydrogenase (fumarate)